MAHCLRDDRASLFSVNSDQFFSALSSRASTPLPLGSQTLPNHEGASSEPATPLITGDPLKQRWTLPFTSHSKSRPGYLRLFPKSLLGHLKRGQPKSGADSTALVRSQELGNPNNTPNTAALTLASSPTTQRNTTQQSPNEIADATAPSPHVRRSTALDEHRIPHDSGYIAVEKIIRNIRAYLSHKRHVSCSAVPNAQISSSENQAPIEALSYMRVEGIERSADTYLITTGDIARILDIVIMGLQDTGGGAHQRAPSRNVSEPVLQGKAGKPSLETGAIVPRMSNQADPATTFSSVQPTFSSTGLVPSYEYRFSQGSFPTATFISRQSVTEVN